ncbi:hypothetical protein [Candidatus Odyssella acanthamoebae]|uniref:Uncharacterized protein n=1 Tax=Candidatus Odyssella acanthamoebae TaxID=91604 RepID=A0A077AZI4_9PROT|nr:hypothetical protein [Candidatus Paracaedibacter acanthamoebae]AIK96150.1 hypothetical protein ID47_04420 [Candidatus Paracaedibacter acanthamoebae]
MKILTVILPFGLMPLFLMSCTPQQTPTTSREAPTASRADLPEKSLPSERLKRYDYGRQSSNADLLTNRTYKPSSLPSSRFPSPEVASPARVDLANKSLPSERIGYGYGYGRQTGKAVLEQINRHK